MAPIHQFVLLGCSRSPNAAAAMQGRPTGGPLLQATAVPRTPALTQVLGTSSPAQPERPKARSSAIAGGGTWWWWAGAMLGLSIHSQNDPESLYFSLLKDSTPHPPLVCWSVFPPVLDNCSGIEALGGMVGRGALWGPRGVSECTLPVPLAAAVPMDNEHREVKGIFIAWRAFQGLRVLSTAPQWPPTQAAEDPRCGPAPSSQ